MGTSTTKISETWRCSEADYLPTIRALNSAIVPEWWWMMKNGDHRKLGRGRGIRGPANDIVPTWVIRNGLMRVKKNLDIQRRP